MSSELFCASGELQIARFNHGLKRFPVVNCGSVTVGDFPPIPGSTYPSNLRTIFGSQAGVGRQQQLIDGTKKVIPPRYVRIITQK